MSDPSYGLFIQSLPAKIPVWMSRSVGFRFVASLIMLLDAGLEALLQALYARFPGVGTSTALPYIGRSRGLLRAYSEADDSFAAWLLGWLDLWTQAATQIGLAKVIQHYANGAKVKVVNRGGVMTTLNTDGSSSVNYSSGWNWDGTSNPERAGFWSEIWIIVFLPPWAQYTGWPGGSAPNGALNISAIATDALRGLIATWKGAHTFCRAVIFSYDATLFDPSTPSTMPDGKFGQWSYPTHTNGARLASSRYSGAFANCRYVIPEQDPNLPS